MNKDKKLNGWRTPSRALLTAYLGVLFYIVFFAWNHGASFHEVGEDGRNYNLTPLLSIYRIGFFSASYVDPLIILGGNILLFFPYGFLLTDILHRKNDRTRTAVFLIVLSTAAALSVFIEVNQYYFTYRVANIDDVILNTSGAFIGYCVWRITSRIVRRRT
ncbi:VanZ family protein [Alkalicoccus saliphilus]|uniref:VanZ family protein n=1 Tax=Alkalicoccus saliphilus TaxID=200989 RepID=A0A2T4U7W6_9BACI|nr:VanZ family protein [Alkalicoccus saliphilus]PTL39486.1 VanZ family protein [Alkalicoccus saliphilus]